LLVDSSEVAATGLMQEDNETIRKSIKGGMYMPRGDRTGPLGLGPMTGRGLGYCAGFPVPGYMNPGPGLGLRRGGYFRWGRGFGRGYGRGFGWFWRRSPGWAPYAARYYSAHPWYVPFGYPGAVDEDTALKNETQALKQEIKFLEDRLAEIDESIKSLGREDEGQNRERDER